MAYNSAHTGPEIDAAVEMLGQIQSARDATSSDRGAVETLASQVAANASQVASQASTVSTKTAQVLASATEVEQAHAEVLSASEAAVDAKDAAAISAESALASQESTAASAFAASQSQLAAGLSEQVSAENVASTSEDRAVVDMLAQQVEADSASAALSAQNAAAVVTGGTATLASSPGKIPLADAQGKIDSEWISEEIARTSAIQGAIDTAQSAKDSADLATARTARFMAPASTPPVIRDDGAALQLGDRYVNTGNQAEYIYKSSGWELNDSLEAIAGIRDATDPAKGAAEVGWDGSNVAAQSVRKLASKTVLRAYLGSADSVSITTNGVIATYLYDPLDNTSTDDDDSVIVGTDGRCWKTQWAAQWRPQKTLYDFMSVAQRADLKAGTGLVDQTSALSAFWQYIKTTFVDVSSEDYVKVVGDIPAGLYRIDGSVNLTNIKARNTILEASGAVFHGRGATKNVVDMTGTRWLQIHGLTVFGDEANPPRSGVLLGPQGTETSGNNAFFGVNVTGHFLKTCFWNIGSETTTYVRTRGANYNQDPASKVYIGDGRMRNGATSDYAVLRAPGVAVSFTNNQFYSCDLRHIGGGAPVWLEFTRGWGFDRGCYFISYNDAIFEIWTTSTSVHQNLSIEGLMETTFKDSPVVGNTGCKHQIKFVGDGTASELEGFTFKVGVPHTALSSIKQDASAGALTLTNVDMVIGHQLTPGVPVFDAPTLTMSGRIQTANATELNINTIAAFNGILVTSGAGSVRPAAGVYVQMNTTSGQLLFGGSGPRVYDAPYRADGALADAAFKGRAKGAGNAELGNEVMLNAFTVQAPTGAVNGLSAKASLTTPSYTVQTVSATLNVGLRSKGSGTKVELGDDAGTNCYLEVGGNTTYAQVRAAGPGANQDLQLEGKGTGSVRFGTKTASADAPVVGYITIKDASGALRKLAVIA